MPGYVPPALRHNPNYEPKKLSLKPKPIDWTQLKTKDEIMKEYQEINKGNADSAWNE